MAWRGSAACPEPLEDIVAGGTDPASVTCLQERIDEPVAELEFSGSFSTALANASAAMPHWPVLARILARRASSVVALKLDA